MSSILDSFKETLSDQYSFVKILVFAVPVYFAYSEYLAPTANHASVFNIFYIMLFFLLGLFFDVTSNVINERDYLMPALNPLKLGWLALRGILAIGPITWISVALANYVISFINIIPWLDITLKSIIWLIVASVVATSYLMFAKEEKVLAAYKLKLLSEKAGDLMVALIFYVIQLAIINVLSSGFIGYAIYVLFGLGPVLYAFCSYAIVFNILATANYMGQLHYEVFGLNKETS